MATSSHAPRSTARTGGKAHEHEHPPCDLYLPGHLVHYIQAKKALRSEDPVRWGRFDGVEDGRLVVRFLDGNERYAIHRPEEVARVAEVGDKVRVSERWRVASISRRFEHVLAVSIALPRDPWRPCSVASGEPGSFEELADRLENRGGFMVSGRVVTGLFGSAPDGGVAGPREGGLDPVS